MFLESHPKKRGNLTDQTNKEDAYIKKEFSSWKKTQNVFTSIETHRAIKPLLRTIWWSHIVQMLENQWIVS